MRNTATKTLPTAALAALLLLAPAAGGGAQSTASAGAVKPAPSSDEVRAAIEEALCDERRSEAIYARVLKDHGDVRPFWNVVRAERRHATFLEDLLMDRGLAVPASPDETGIPGYPSVKEACAAAVALETTNVALYDRLLAAGPLPDDVRRAFDHNRVASLDRHKPAFERCAGVATAQPGGRDRGHGARHGAGHGGGCGPACGQGCRAGGGGGCGHCGHGRGGHGQGRS